MKLIKLYQDNLSSVIREASRVLKGGGLVVFPSDTVYGLLVDAKNVKAVEKLIALKGRPAGKAISVFVSDFKMLGEIVRIKKDTLATLDRLLPGPFTMVLTSKHTVSKLLESETGTLGVRIPNYDPVTKLVSSCHRPVTATSANISGRPPHYTIGSFLKEISMKKKKLIDLIVDAGKLPRNKPSTIIDLTLPTITVIRKGDITVKDAQTFVSHAPIQTKKIAQYLIQKILVNEPQKPIVFIIEGELGVGKTIFVKGIGEYFGIRNIISPTFVIYFEYQIQKKPIKQLVHVDLYRLEEAEEFKYLGLEKYLEKGNLLCFEWGEKVGPIFEMLKKKGEVVYVKIRYANEGSREIDILDVKQKLKAQNSPLRPSDFAGQAKRKTTT
ncbi:threonylcarbamoyl-AMP synthase [Candidatus Roizmanbacteria bacterium]|nr:threonylcarbamoyl-AMP synthase [Candidatus Roizmanbacteria bacterium]